MSERTVKVGDVLPDVRPLQRTGKHTHWEGPVTRRQTTAKDGDTHMLEGPGAPNKRASFWKAATSLLNDSEEKHFKPEFSSQKERDELRELRV